MNRKISKTDEDVLRQDHVGRVSVPIFRTGDIIMVLVMLCAAFWTYEVKYEAQRRYQEIRILERKIETEEDTASILRARWALATEPARIERLAAQYHDELDLETIEPRQIVKIEDIPQKLPDAIEMVIKDSDNEFLQGGDGALLAKMKERHFGKNNLDTIETGSVEPLDAQKTANSRKTTDGGQKNGGKAL